MNAGVHVLEHSVQCIIDLFDKCVLKRAQFRALKTRENRKRLWMPPLHSPSSPMCCYMLRLHGLTLFCFLEEPGTRKLVPLEGPRGIRFQVPAPVKNDLDGIEKRPP